MNYCVDCHEFFDTPDFRIDSVSEAWGHTITHFVATCPHCGSVDLEDAIKCRVCGEWSTESVCEYCQEIATDTAKKITDLIAETAVENELDYDELFEIVMEEL